jgi:cation diffusion facilitator CzcD-associated flavoprotein CzcO
MTIDNAAERRVGQGDDAPPHYEVIVVGAGPVGLYQLHRLREQGLSVRGLEAGSGVGGTWYWNRYPGARLDSEAYSYGFSCSAEILNEWTWSEEFAGQPALEKYYNFVADKLELRGCIDFGTRVNSAVFNETTNSWSIGTEDGRRYSAQFLVAATGILSAPFTPDIPGRDDFTGGVYHTARWPKEQPSFVGRRVAVIGTGSSGIQLIQALGPQVRELTVLQRSANWATPINNSPITQERAAEIRATYDAVYETTRTSAGCFAADGRPDSTWDVSAEERVAYYEELWNAPGLSMLTRNFSDVMTDRAANDTVTAFLTEKIQERVNDPEVAKKLIPDHGFGMKRPPLEHGYYEVFNQDNVELVNLREEPILRFNATGIETNRRQIDLDDVVLATGFDALTGSFVRMGIQGVGGVSLAEYWADGPRTYLGLTAHHFPNFFFVGPQGVAGNFPRCAEPANEWIAACILDARSHGVERVEAGEAAEREWVDMINETVKGTIHKDAESWIWGSNVPGKARAFSAYLLPMPEYARTLEEVARNGYAGFERSGRTRPLSFPVRVGGGPPSLDGP